jgi:hypothetical protein
MTAATDIREHLVRALKADLVGPDDQEHPDAGELLRLPPSRWYLTGFLAPELGRDEDEDSTKDDELGAGDDENEEETTGQEPEAKQKKRMPASIGMSVLLPPGSSGKTLTATVRYADYIAESAKSEGAKRPYTVWVRQSRQPKLVPVSIDAKTIGDGVEVPDSGGICLIGKLEDAGGRGLDKGTKALSLFVVNRRPVAESKARADEQCIFQVSLELHFAAGFAPRSNRQGELSDDWDERVADLQFRDRAEYAVGHGVAVEVPSGQMPVTTLRTTWVPRAEVRRVRTRAAKGVEVRIAELGRLENAAAVEQALSSLPRAYHEWIETQAKKGVGTKERVETRNELLQQARRAEERIAAGIEILKTDRQALEAFRLANRAMATAAEKRGRYEPGDVPKWRLFQLAFIVLNLRGIVREEHGDRNTVELIFFPTGGGKTEAYLGVVAFTLLLRRLRGRERPDKGLGVAVLLRYTLRLLTLDQLGRATTLVCALEQIRKEQPTLLGDVRFSVGLWVGKSATANTFKEVAKKIIEYKNSPSKTAASPFPIPRCPWCDSDLSRDSLELVPSPSKATGVLVGCTNFHCDFAPSNNREGLPVLFVDEQVYRELPSFIVATVDKFAMLPWRGETGMLFGRVHGRSGGSFVGPLDGKAKYEHKLPEGLRPPELIIQDELHLIAGPLGTMVGLFETAIEKLCTREGQKPVRPKVIAATATVRRAHRQIQALFGRNDTAIFPPLGMDDSESYFAEVDTDAPGRLYIGVAASGRSMKRILLRVYASLLSAAERIYDPLGSATQPSDAYMTLVGYFNSLRELGGMRRLVEDEVRTRCDSAEERRPENTTESRWYKNRPLQREPVELTSRESTGKIAESRGRLTQPYNSKERVDVLLASNMISVGIDIDRLGLMVVAGQPKTTSEYIQASSRVGRTASWPGLVVTCFNMHKPRDRSHYERFTAYHESFYRFVEAMSLTPFSGPALDRGLAGTILAMVRLLDADMTPPLAAMTVDAHPGVVKRVIKCLKDRAKAQPGNGSNNTQAISPQSVAKRAQNVIDAWTRIVAKAKEDEASSRSYSRFDREKATKQLLFTPLDEGKPRLGDEAKFAAPTSMRDVEPVAHLWKMRGRLGGKSHG